MSNKRIWQELISHQMFINQPEKDKGIWRKVNKEKLKTTTPCKLIKFH